MLSEQDLQFIRHEMWQLTYEEAQQLHQVLVAEWTFDNPSTEMTILIAEVRSFVRQRQMERRNIPDRRITDGERVALRDVHPVNAGLHVPWEEDVAGWRRLKLLLTENGVTISQLGDCP